ncbi:hypothetical protein OIV83_000938 [Microbotryomycetes sp. JL201]|nr:hypothetical protein OIV83_000938 [Microbotryomycetes sp. JL201]
MSVFSSARLAGKRVLVTGASVGIGRETAVLFARAGANLIICARRQDALMETAELAKAANREGGSGQGGEVVTELVDMQDRAAIKAFVDRVKDSKIDILVNKYVEVGYNKWTGIDRSRSAGLVKGVETVGEIADDDIDVMFNTNVIGLIALTQHFVKIFKQQQSGHIINLGSIAGKEAYPGGSIYCATKHAVSAFNISLFKEMNNTPIRVTQICPGLVETEFSVTRFRGDKDKAAQVYKGIQPLVAADIAEEIVWAASRPEHVNIADVLVFPNGQAAAQMIHRQ